MMNDIIGFEPMSSGYLFYCINRQLGTPIEMKLLECIQLANR
jgi:hypothetical protein